MGKVTTVKKSRKIHTCSKCGATIEVGSTYYVGKINFSPDIVRCTKCGLKPWEVTTSDYLLQAGRLVNEFDSEYDMSAAGVDDIVSELEEMLSELQDKLYSMPDSLKDSDTGNILQERIDGIDSALSDLSNISEDDVKEEVLSSLGREETVEDADWEKDEELINELSDHYTSIVEEALSQVCL